jgi:hypothetical protein
VNDLSHSSQEYGHSSPYIGRSSFRILCKRGGNNMKNPSRKQNKFVMQVQREVKGLEENRVNGEGQGKKKGKICACPSFMARLTVTDRNRYYTLILANHLCGLVARVPDCKSRGPRFDSRRYQIF